MMPDEADGLITFKEILHFLPLEVILMVKAQVYHCLDIEHMIRTSIPSDFQRNPFIPYMELDYPYIRFKAWKFRGGINLYPRGFNDMILTDSTEHPSMKPLSEVLNTLFHERTVVMKMVIYCNRHGSIDIFSK